MLSPWACVTADRLSLDQEKLLKQYRKKPLFEGSGLPIKLSCNRHTIEKIIPQREPILLVDALTGLDLEEGAISGVRNINPADPVFKGHFPDYPVYPGSYTLEMIGQLSLCLHYFLERKTMEVADDAAFVSALATRIWGAYFLEPILPGAKVELLAKKVDYSGYLATAIGQALVNGRVCCVSLGEVAIL